MKGIRIKKLNITNISQKDVDRYTSFQENFKAVGKHKQKYERPYIKVYKDMLKFPDLTLNAVILYSVIRNFIQIDYVKYTKEPEMDNEGNSNLIGKKKTLSYDILMEWSSIKSTSTMNSTLKLLAEYGFISYEKSNNKSSLTFTLLRDMATYQLEEISAIQDFMWDKDIKGDEEDEFDW